MWNSYINNTSDPIQIYSIPSSIYHSTDLSVQASAIERMFPGGVMIFESTGEVFLVPLRRF